MSKLIRKDFGFKVKEVSEKGEFTAYASVFGVKDSYDDIVQKGAFLKSLEKWKEKDRFPPILWQHDTKEPIGTFSKIIEDAKGLYVEGRLLIDDDPLAKRAYAHMKAGTLGGLSIGYLVDDLEYDTEKEAYILKEISLAEISFVTFPANEQATVQDIKSILSNGEIPLPNQVERVLRDAGFSRQQAKAFMSKGYSSLSQREADNSAEIKEITDLMKSALDAFNKKKEI